MTADVVIASAVNLIDVNVVIVSIVIVSVVIVKVAIVVVTIIIIVIIVILIFFGIANFVLYNRARRSRLVLFLETSSIYLCTNGTKVLISCHYGWVC